MEQTSLFGTEKIDKMLLRLAPPVMLVQLLMIALAVGTGVGINTVMAAKLGEGRQKEADEYAGVGAVPAPYKEDFPPRHAEYPHAVGVHLLHIRP